MGGSKYNHPSRTHDHIFIFLSHTLVIPICQVFVTFLLQFWGGLPPHYFLFYFSRMSKYLEKSDKLFSVPLMRRGIFSVIGVPFVPMTLLGYTCYYPIVFLWHAITWYVFILVLFHNMPCHVNILFPCPVCVSGYRILWHAIVYKKFYIC